MVQLSKLMTELFNSLPRRKNLIIVVLVILMPIFMDMHQMLDANEQD